MDVWLAKTIFKTYIFHFACIVLTMYVENLYTLFNGRNMASITVPFVLLS